MSRVLHPRKIGERISAFQDQVRLDSLETPGLSLRSRKEKKGNSVPIVTLGRKQTYFVGVNSNQLFLQRSSQGALNQCAPARYSND
jgi:hypothetical protein